MGGEIKRVDLSRSSSAGPRILTGRWHSESSNRSSIHLAGRRTARCDPDSPHRFRGGTGMSVLILDFGSQYSRLIARRIRELNAYSVILPGTASVERIRKERPQAIVLSGSPKSVFESDAPMPDPAIYDLGIPILGICYGIAADPAVRRRCRGCWNAILWC